MQLSVGPYQSLRVVPSTGDACCSSCARGGACEGTCPASAPSPMDALRSREKATGWPSYGRRSTGDVTADDGGDGGDGGDAGDDSPDVEALGQKWANLSPAARRNALQRIGAAAGLSSGETQRMVTSLVNAGLSTVNAWLRSNTQIEIRRIEANRDIAIARIRAGNGGSGITPIDGGGNNTNGELVITTTQRDSSSSSSDNTLLYVGLGLAALWAMKGKR